MTADDLLAVSMLSVRVIRYYALDVLVYRAGEISALLAQIAVDVKLSDAGADKLIAEGSPAWELWKLLCDIKPSFEKSQLGPVAAGKLLARKRPQLIPVYDSYVERVLERTRAHGSWWADLRGLLLADTAFVSQLESTRICAGADAAHLSLLRIFDIMCWMHWRKPGGGVGASVAARA